MALSEPLRHRIADVALWPTRVVRRQAAAAGVFFSSQDRKLAALTDTAKGKRAFVIGLGPSLQMEDLDRISSEVTLSCNKCFLAFEKTAWRPDFYSIAGIDPARNNLEAILESDFGPGCQPVHSRVVQRVLKHQPNALFADYSKSIQGWPTGRAPELPKNLATGMLRGGRTAIVTCIQVAYAIGYIEVVLVGVDFNYNIPIAPSGGDSTSGRTVLSDGQSQHFHPDYFKPGDRWAIPKLDEQRTAFAFCEEAFRRSGRRLINASRNTKLDVLEKVDFDDII